MTAIEINKKAKIESGFFLNDIKAEIKIRNKKIIRMSDRKIYSDPIIIPVIKSIENLNAGIFLNPDIRINKFQSLGVKV
ncbi:MAG: hypothetical protein M3R36_16480 [Bacteroidota bacterium]|nr:hypothetical protein [Bacteroidota bacterium]